jgi:hypothetical protein
MEMATIGRAMITAATLAYDHEDGLLYLCDSLAGIYYSGDHQSGKVKKGIGLKGDKLKGDKLWSDTVALTQARTKMRGYNMMTHMRVLYWAVNGTEPAMPLERTREKTGFLFEECQYDAYWEADRSIAQFFTDGYSLRGYFHFKGIGPMEGACRACMSSKEDMCV